MIRNHHQSPMIINRTPNQLSAPQIHGNSNCCCCLNYSLIPMVLLSNKVQGSEKYKITQRILHRFYENASKEHQKLRTSKKEDKQKEDFESRNPALEDQGFVIDMDDYENVRENQVFAISNSVPQVNEESHSILQPSQAKLKAKDNQKEDPSQMDEQYSYDSSVLADREYTQSEPEPEPEVEENKEKQEKIELLKEQLVVQKQISPFVLQNIESISSIKKEYRQDIKLQNKQFKIKKKVQIPEWNEETPQNYYSYEEPYYIEQPQNSQVYSETLQFEFNHLAMEAQRLRMQEKCQRLKQDLESQQEKQQTELEDQQKQQKQEQKRADDNNNILEDLASELKQAQYIEQQQDQLLKKEQPAQRKQEEIDKVSEQDQDSFKMSSHSYYQNGIDKEFAQQGSQYCIESEQNPSYNYSNDEEEELKVDEKYQSKYQSDLAHVDFVVELKKQQNYNPFYAISEEQYQCQEGTKKVKVDYNQQQQDPQEPYESQSHYEVGQQISYPNNEYEEFDDLLKEEENDAKKIQVINLDDSESEYSKEEEKELINSVQQVAFISSPPKISKKDALEIKRMSKGQRKQRQESSEKKPIHCQIVKTFDFQIGFCDPQSEKQPIQKIIQKKAKRKLLRDPQDYEQFYIIPKTLIQPRELYAPRMIKRKVNATKIMARLQERKRHQTRNILRKDEEDISYEIIHSRPQKKSRSKKKIYTYVETYEDPTPLKSRVISDSSSENQQKQSHKQ